MKIVQLKKQEHVKFQIKHTMENVAAISEFTASSWLRHQAAVKFLPSTTGQKSHFSHALDQLGGGQSSALWSYR